MGHSEPTQAICWEFGQLMIITLTFTLTWPPLVKDSHDLEVTATAPMGFHLFCFLPVSPLSLSFFFRKSGRPINPGPFQLPSNSPLEDFCVAKLHFCKGPFSLFPGAQLSLCLFLLVSHLVTFSYHLDESWGRGDVDLSVSSAGFICRGWWHRRAKKSENLLASSWQCL